MNQTFQVLGALALLCSCNRVAEGTKDALNKGGELAGSAATEVIEGVATGVENTWTVDVVLSDELKAQGLAIGKTQVESGSEGMANRLIVYLSSDKAFSGDVSAIATDEEGREMGRATTALTLAAGSADYYTLQFQARTDLERKSRVVIR